MRAGARRSRLEGTGRAAAPSTFRFGGGGTRTRASPNENFPLESVVKPTSNPARRHAGASSSSSDDDVPGESSRSTSKRVVALRALAYEPPVGRAALVRRAGPRDVREVTTRDDDGRDAKDVDATFVCLRADIAGANPPSSRK